MGKFFLNNVSDAAGRVNLDKGHQCQVEFSSGLKKMTTLKKNCSSCSPDAVLLDNCGTQSAEELTGGGGGGGDDGEVNLLAKIGRAHV